MKVIGSECLVSITQSAPPLLETKNLITTGLLETEALRVLVSSDAFTIIDLHAKSDTTQEVGGFLFCRLYVWEGQTYVELAILSLP